MGIKNTLSVYFVKCIIKIVISGLLILIVTIALVIWGINQEFLLPANESINQAEEIKNEIVSMDYIDSSTLPPELDYAIFNKQTKKLVESNMSSKNTAAAKEVYENDKMNSFIKYDSRYETILIHNTLKVQFANTKLRRVFPNPGVWLLVFSIIIYCIYLVWNIRGFSHTIIKENQKLVKVASKIKEKDLNIEFPRVRFNEYKDVMEAMESLSEALAKSIQKEIEVTNSKAEQISYLMHDIKIPLTVIKGNIELLETMKNDDTEENFSDIMNSIKQIEHYMQEVIDINLNNKQLEMNKEKISLINFLGKLKNEVNSLNQNIIVDDFTEKGTCLFIDISLLIRAIINIVLNGVERTPQHDKVQIIIKQDNEYIQFIIIDRGPGFSEEALKKGAELFYTENQGRTNNSHYGLGLTFTEKVIKQHNGRMKLSNNASHFGEVLVELPVLALDLDKEMKNITGEF